MKFHCKALPSLFAATFLFSLNLHKISAERRIQSIANASTKTNPYIPPRTLIDGIVEELSLSSGDYEFADVYGCCSAAEAATCFESDQSCSDYNDVNLSPSKIGSMPQFTKDQSLHVLEIAKKAWNNGAGTWPQMSIKDRINAIENFVEELKKSREEIVIALMWEIGKNRKDAEAEFDRTMQFIKQSIESIRSSDNADFDSDFRSIGSTRAFARRAAIGIIMCLGPYNYPLNETYATLIPALLMGNVVIMKVPTIGGLAHLLTMDAFAKTLPPGAINFISGGGRATMPPLMSTGYIDALAFIGGSSAADDLIRQHPEPHRLKIFLQLEAKNMGIYLPDLFEYENASILDQTISETITGTLSFNGQRCTALKLLFVPKAHGDAFAEKLSNELDTLRVGLPWQEWRDENGKVNYAHVTPLPNVKRIKYMQSLISDALSKGAKILNKDGGKVIGGEDSTLMVPALLYPVDKTMDLYYEEQFGPVIPITTYADLDAVYEYGQEGKYGQQVSIFTTQGGEDTVSLVDRFSSVFGKINLNAQCGRSPDSLAFSGRRSSALGVMSIQDALKEFSIPTVVAYKKGSVGGDVTEEMAKSIQTKSNFMQSIL